LPTTRLYKVVTGHRVVETVEIQTMNGFRTLSPGRYEAHTEFQYLTDEDATIKILEGWNIELVDENYEWQR